MNRCHFEKEPCSQLAFLLCGNTELLPALVNVPRGFPYFDPVPVQV